ncbi:MAG TPA: hypothetical protein VK528_11470 [Flavobacterium sp.]|nr:hypothetical protein [Flavobacterium sp.]
MGLFFVINGVLFVRYFVPNIEKANNIDQLENALLQVKETIPGASKVYFLTEKNIKDNPEIYYKTQFSLAPGVLIAEKYENIPNGSYMLQVHDKKIKDEILPKYPGTIDISVNENDYFQIVLLKKD